MRWGQAKINPKSWVVKYLLIPIYLIEGALLSKINSFKYCLSLVDVGLHFKFILPLIALSNFFVDCAGIQNIQLDLEVIIFIFMCI